MHCHHANTNVTNAQSNRHFGHDGKRVQILRLVYHDLHRSLVNAKKKHNSDRLLKKIIRCWDVSDARYKHQRLERPEDRFKITPEKN